MCVAAAASSPRPTHRRPSLGAAPPPWWTGRNGLSGFRGLARFSGSKRSNGPSRRRCPSRAGGRGFGGRRLAFPRRAPALLEGIAPGAGPPTTTSGFPRSWARGLPSGPLIVQQRELHPVSTARAGPAAVAPCPAGRVRRSSRPGEAPPQRPAGVVQAQPFLRNSRAAFGSNALLGWLKRDFCSCRRAVRVGAGRAPPRGPARGPPGSRGRRRHACRGRSAWRAPRR